MNNRQNVIKNQTISYSLLDGAGWGLEYREEAEAALSFFPACLRKRKGTVPTVSSHDLLDRPFARYHCFGL